MAVGITISGMSVGVAAACKAVISPAGLLGRQDRPRSPIAERETR